MTIRTYTHKEFKEFIEDQKDDRPIDRIEHTPISQFAKKKFKKSFISGGTTTVRFKNRLFQHKDTKAYAFAVAVEYAMVMHGPINNYGQLKAFMKTRKFRFRE